MQVIDVWMAVVVGYECLRLGYEARSSEDLNYSEFPVRLVTSAVMVMLLAFTWYFAQ